MDKGMGKVVPSDPVELAAFKAFWKERGKSATQYGIFRAGWEARGESTVDTAQRDLIAEMLQRYGAALDSLRDVLGQRERARDMARPDFAHAWAKGAQGFIDLGNWLDERMEATYGKAED